MSRLLQTIEVETGSNPRWSVIWLHGLGADGNDFVPIVPELNLTGTEPIRFVFPHAPVIPVTCNGGMPMRAWYDILVLSSIDRKVDEAGIRESTASIRVLIDQERARDIPSSRVILAGFSQGGAMAYTVGLSHPERLAGIIALSTYLPNASAVLAEVAKPNITTPVFAGHGTYDPVVPFAMGLEAARAIARNGRSVEWHAWPMQHNVCPEEVQAIGAWLRNLVGNT